MAEEEARELLLDLDGVVWTAIGQPLVDEGETPLLIGSDCLEARRHRQAMSFGNGREAHVNGCAISQRVEASMHESLNISLCQSSIILGHGFRIAWRHRSWHSSCWPQGESKTAS